MRKLQLEKSNREFSFFFLRRALLEQYWTKAALTESGVSV